MATTLLYRLFGLGKFSKSLLTELQAEGILIQDDGISGSATYTNFRSPRRYAGWRREWFTASLALTQSRFVVVTNASMAFNVPLADSRLRDLTVTCAEPELLTIAFDASRFHTNWSGNIEYRFRTAQAQTFAELLQK